MSGVSLPPADHEAAQARNALSVRGGLPAEFTWLRDRFPRSEWRPARVHAMARFLLERHAWFRMMQGRMTALSQADAAPGLYRQGVIPLLQAFLPSLDQHHRIETAQAFPDMIALQPAMARGFALLDRDHDAIHAKLAAVVDTATLLINSAGPALTDPAHALAEELVRLSRLLARHLEDEEDIVVPLLTLHGDPLGVSR